MSHPIPHNNFPTLDPIDDLGVSIYAGMQEVCLTGITAGVGHSEDPEIHHKIMEKQDLDVTAYSDNPSLFSHLHVEYSSPNDKGTLFFTPSGASGKARITVTVTDWGIDKDLETPEDNLSVSRTFLVVCNLDDCHHIDVRERHGVNPRTQCDTTATLPPSLPDPMPNVTISLADDAEFNQGISTVYFTVDTSVTPTDYLVEAELEIELARKVEEDAEEQKPGEWENGVINDAEFLNPSVSFNRSVVSFCPGEFSQDVELHIPQSDIFHKAVYWRYRLKERLNCSVDGGWKTFAVLDDGTGQGGNVDNRPEVIIQHINDHLPLPQDANDPRDPKNPPPPIMAGTDDDENGALLVFRMIRIGQTVQGAETVVPFDYQGPGDDFAKLVYPSNPEMVLYNDVNFIYFRLKEDTPPEEDTMTVTVTLSEEGESSYYYRGQHTKAKSTFIDSFREEKGILIGREHRSAGMLAPAESGVFNNTTTTLPPELIREQGTFSSGGGSSLKQHVFLGASVADFTLNAGFGDSASTMNVTLIEDATTDASGPHKYPDVFGKRNSVTGTPYVEKEEDASLKGIKVGEPAFFCFGESLQKPMTGHNKNHTGGEDGLGKTYTDDGTNGFHRMMLDLYGYTALAKRQSPHFAFGGLLQSWNSNRDATGGLIHNVTIVDPREILQNFQVILNNHAGTTYANDNMINVYGFLEHVYVTNNGDGVARNEKFYNTNYMKESWTIGDGGEAAPFIDPTTLLTTKDPNYDILNKYEILTGVGYSLRSELGIPCFRVIQAINCIMGLHSYPMTSQYYQYGGYCSFRKKLYAIDMSDVPIPDFNYQLNYDSINLLDLCMELADACNHEIMVHLLPVHDGITVGPWVSNGYLAKFIEHKIAGVIKITSVDRNTSSSQVSQSYIENLPFDVTTKDIGVELSNEVTDKFVTGANEVNHYYFNSKHDNKPLGNHGAHEIDRNLGKQIIPYYGLLHNNVVTFPRGRGPWTQIVLDATACSAMGVGEFYVTTEMELRAADISFDKWVEFLQSYNSLFHEVIFDGQAIDNVDSWLNKALNWVGADGYIKGTRECTVPRCTHPPCKKDFENWQKPDAGQWCSPPYGYPLYWERAKAIGIFTGSATGGSNKNPKAKNAPDAEALENRNKGQAKPKNNAPDGDASFDPNKNFEDAVSAALAKVGLENAKKVYAFVKGVADECLGKKFLVKIPQKPNLKYGSKKYFIGFPKRMNNDLVDSTVLNKDGTWTYNDHKAMLAPVDPTTERARGALTIGYNAAKGEYAFNYYPEPAGGVDNPISIGAPPVIRAFFEENGRISAFVKLPYTEDISMDSFDKDTTFKYAPPAANGEPDPNAKSSVFVKADLDSRWFVAPKFITKTQAVYGCSSKRMEDLEGEVEGQTKFNEEGEESIAQFIKPKVYGPKKFPDRGQQNEIDTEDAPEESEGNEDSGPVQVKQIDLDAALDQEMQGFTAGFDVYALITIPRPTLTEEGEESKGESLKVNAGNVGHFYREDVVRGMPGFETVSTPSKIKLEGGHDPADVRATMMKAVEGLSFSLDRRIKIFSPGPIFPELVALPLKSTQRSYGPWYNTNTNNGKVEYSRDESLAPWNYAGSFSDMDTAGKLAVLNNAAYDLQQERASFTMVGWPKGMTVGRFLESGGPAITNISTSFSTDGIRTTVTMDSYTPSFGKMQKQKQALLQRMSRERQKVKDHQNKLIREKIVNPRTNSTMDKEEAKLRKKIKAEMNSSYGNQLTPEERGEIQAANEFAMTVNTSAGMLVDKNNNTTLVNPEVASQGDFEPNALTSTQGTMQSSRATGQMSKVLSENAFQYYKQYWLSISSSIDEVFHPASSTWHNVFPSMGQQIDLILYKDSIDNDNQISYYD